MGQGVGGLPCLHAWLGTGACRASPAARYQTHWHAPRTVLGHSPWGKKQERAPQARSPRHPNPAHPTQLACCTPGASARRPTSRSTRAGSSHCQRGTTAAAGDSRKAEVTSQRPCARAKASCCRRCQASSCASWGQDGQGLRVGRVAKDHIGGQVRVGTTGGAAQWWYLWQQPEAGSRIHTAAAAVKPFAPGLQG